MRAVPLARRDLEAGRPATEGTLRWMGEVVRQESLAPRLRARVRRIFADAGVSPFDVDGEIAAVFDWVVSQVRYQRDPVGAEYLTGPLELDQQIDDGDAAEDCDGMAMYAAALLAAAGIPSEFEAVGWDAQRPSNLRHVYLSVIHPRTGERTAFDPVAAQYNGSELGTTLWREGLPLERWTMEGTPVRRGDMMDVAFGDLGLTREEGEDVAGKVLGVASGLLNVLGPYGQIVGGVINIGGAAYESATGRKLGTVVPATPSGAPPAGGPANSGGYVPLPGNIPPEQRAANTGASHFDRGGGAAPTPPIPPVSPRADDSSGGSGSSSIGKILPWAAGVYVLAKVLR